MVRPERIELPTSWFVAMRSIQLSYGRNFRFAFTHYIGKEFFSVTTESAYHRLTRTQSKHGPSNGRWAAKFLAREAGLQSVTIRGGWRSLLRCTPEGCSVSSCVNSRQGRKLQASVSG
jgi:hypothetical protein